MLHSDMPALHYVCMPSHINKQSNPKNQYDHDIRHIVWTFNQYIRKKYPNSNYHDLDWHIIKAIIWVESGQQCSAWRYRPMQIGNRHDSGLKAILHSKEIYLQKGKVYVQNEGADFVIPPEYSINLTVKNKEKICHNPLLNIQAGITYLLMRHAKFGYKTVINFHSKEYIVSVKSGDNLNKIAIKNQTTVGLLTKLNPQVNRNKLQVGMALRYQKATIQKTIIGWYPMSFNSIARKYNANGDPQYQQKLRYMFSEITH